MTSSPAAAFQLTAEAAQQAAGVIAARHRGDFEGANTLLASLDDQARAAGCLFLADLAIALLAQADGCTVDGVAAQLCRHIAALSPAIGD